MPNSTVPPIADAEHDESLNGIFQPWNAKVPRRGENGKEYEQYIQYGVASGITGFSLHSPQQIAQGRRRGTEKKNDGESKGQGKLNPISDLSQFSHFSLEWPIHLSGECYRSPALPSRKCSNKKKLGCVAEVSPCERSSSFNNSTN